MTITAIDESQRKAARVAGFISLFTLPFVVFANFAIHDRLIVAGNVAETARNIIAHERLFRFSIACDLIYCAGLVILLTALRDLMQAGNVTPVIDKRYRLSEVPEAIRYLEDGHARGKVVITLGNNNKTGTGNRITDARPK